MAALQTYGHNVVFLAKDAYTYCVQCGTRVDDGTKAHVVVDVDSRVACHQLCWLAYADAKNKALDALLDPVCFRNVDDPKKQEQLRQIARFHSAAAEWKARAPGATIVVVPCSRVLTYPFAVHFPPTAGWVRALDDGGGKAACAFAAPVDQWADGYAVVDLEYDASITPDDVIHELAACALRGIPLPTGVLLDIRQCVVAVKPGRTAVYVRMRVADAGHAAKFHPLCGIGAARSGGGGGGEDGIVRINQMITTAWAQVLRSHALSIVANCRRRFETDLTSSQLPVNAAVTCVHTGNQFYTASKDVVDFASGIQRDDGALGLWVEDRASKALWHFPPEETGASWFPFAHSDIWVRSPVTDRVPARVVCEVVYR